MEVRELSRDVLVLGGGPAGTVAALSLRQTAPGLSIVLVERVSKPLHMMEASR